MNALHLAAYWWPGADEKILVPPHYNWRPVPGCRGWWGWQTGGRADAGEERSHHIMGGQEAPAAAMGNIMSPQCNCGAHVWCKMSLANHSDKMGLLWLWAAVWRLAKYKNTARQQNSQTEKSPIMLARVDSTMLPATPTGDSLMEKSCAKKIWLPSKMAWCQVSSVQDNGQKKSVSFCPH